MGCCDLGPIRDEDEEEEEEEEEEVDDDEEEEEEAAAVAVFVPPMISKGIKSVLEQYLGLRQLGHVPLSAPSRR